MPSYKNLDRTAALAKLANLPKTQPKEQLDAAAIENRRIGMGGGLTYCYAGKGLSERHLEALDELAKEQQAIEKYHELLNGAPMNTGEKRMVLHHLSRGQLGGNVEYEGKNLRAFYQNQQQRFAAFAKKIHSKAILGSTGKELDTIVQIGIGGSDLGPRALYVALKNGYPQKMQARFISNVDPDEAAETLNQINIETTLFILVSKSGTTQETLANCRFVEEAAKKQNIAGLNIFKHFIAVTGDSSPLAKNANFLDAFYIDDFIGGRYSSCSAVGGVPLCLIFGPEVFEELLAGAAEADRLALNPDPRQNAALLDALAGIYERNALGYGSTAVLPYSQALNRFPAHLQQLDMESNGKSVNRNNETIHYQTGPVVFGEPGTNGQHSFYQLLHQGSDIIPLQFIGFKESQLGQDALFQNSSSQVKLNANLAAQIAAFVFGKANSNANKAFTGNRPCSLIYGQKLTAKALGALLAHFENKIMFQGFLWNINSFDQEGVQLGKILTEEILQKKADETTMALAALLGL